MSITSRGSASPRLVLSRRTSPSPFVAVDIERALNAGAEAARPLSDQFYGHLSGRVRDPFGREWIISQEIEKLTPQEKRRWDEMVREVTPDYKCQRILKI